jgi:tetratricopeptide (TPR) repeat protein
MIRKWGIQMVLILFAASIAESQSLSLATEYLDHNLKEHALLEFIQVYNASQSSSNEKAEALYYMGQISFDSQRYDAAMKDWKRLVSAFPETSWAKEINDRLVQLRDIFTKISDENIDSVIAKSYINNGDFWSNSERTFMIDSSWLPNVELANDWYNKVIQEFPGTTAAEVAFKHKLFNLIGWVDSGKYGSKYGLKADFGQYMPIFVDTFNDMERMFPASSNLQAFRYQIAQAYWLNTDWKNTRLWLHKVVVKGEGIESFYTKAANARLKRLNTRQTYRQFLIDRSNWEGSVRKQGPPYNKTLELTPGVPFGTDAGI